MATVIHESIGDMDCMGCGKPVPVKKTAGGNGKLKAQCGWCDHTVYAHPGTIFYKNFMTRVRLTQAAPPEPAAAATAGADDERAPAKKAAAGAPSAKAPWER